jgi:hypothetical protein
VHWAQLQLPGSIAGARARRAQPLMRRCGSGCALTRGQGVAWHRLRRWWQRAMTPL